MKTDSLLPYLPKVCKGKNLKPTGIRKDRPVPGHKFVQPSQLLYNPLLRINIKKQTALFLHDAYELLLSLAGQSPFHRYIRCGMPLRSRILHLRNLIFMPLISICKCLYHFYNQFYTHIQKNATTICQIYIQKHFVYFLY